MLKLHKQSQRRQQEKESLQSPQMAIKNQTNKGKYRLLSFIYDSTVDNPWFNRARRREFELAQIQPDQRVLVIGIGTGLDIPYIPAYAEVVGIDLSKEMLSRAKIKAVNRNISLYEMNAEQLSFEDRSFDIVVLNLILSVVDDPRQTLREVFRVLKPTGSIWILGKFIESQIGPMRKALSFFTSAIGGANINLSLNELIKDLPLIRNYAEPGVLADIIHLKLS
jgi:phosphatidylethanolamine/phosphatidyl-N-methylethanolamine N-methyltransferase